MADDEPQRSLSMRDVQLGMAAHERRKAAPELAPKSSSQQRGSPGPGIDGDISRSESINKQLKWLAQNEAGADVEAAPKPGFNKAKMRWRVAGHAVRITNRSRRRFADGTFRNSVKTAAKEELEAQMAHGHAATGLYFISAQAQTFFEHTYSAMGGWIARSHHVAMLIGLLILLSGIPGTFMLKGGANFLWFKVDSDLHAFALTSTTQYMDFERIAHDAHHGYFHPPRGALVVLSPQVNAAGARVSTDGVLSYPFMRDSLDIMNAVYALTVVGADGATYGFADLCALAGDAPDRPAHAHYDATHQPAGDISHCASRGADIFAAPINWEQASLTALAGPEQSVGNTNDFATVLYMRDAANNQMLYGGFNASGNFRASLKYVDTSIPYTRWAPTTLQIPVFLEHPHGDARLVIVKQWESAMATYLTTGGYAHADTVRVSTIVESTFESAMQDGLYALTPWIFVVVIVMVLYSGLFLSTQTRTSQGEATQFSLIAQGSAVSGLAGFSSFGWIYYLGLDSINVLCICAVFLVAAVGVDCTFIFVSAMKAAGPESDLKDAMPMAMAEGAGAVTLTSLTSICAFAVSAATSGSQPAFLKFNLVMAIALTLNFFGFIFFFAGWQVENEKRILAGRADLNPFVKKKPGKLPEWVDVGSKLRLFINKNYAPLMPEKAGLKGTMCKLVGATVMLATFVISCCFVNSIGVGMPDEWLVPDSSYLYQLTADFTALTNSSRTATISMHIEHLDLMHPTKLASFVSTVLTPLSERDDVYSVSCLPALYLAYQAAAAQVGAPPLAWDIWINSTATNPIPKVIFGRRWHGVEIGQYSGVEVPREIVCSITGEVSSGADSMPRIDAMDWYQNLSTRLNTQFADTCFPCDATRVTFFSKDWAMKTSFDKELPNLVWFTIVLALCVVGGVLLLALPVHRALISVLNIFLVVFAIIGFMGYAGVTYNLISYCTLTMAIGFCVDYTVELMHFSVIGAPTDTMGVKFGNALKACGYDVLHGCDTAIIGVIILGLSGAEYARLFSKLSIVMCLYGGCYALWSLPSSMTITNMAAGAVCGAKAAAPNGANGKASSA